jgi:hypothetical protein
MKKTELIEYIVENSDQSPVYLKDKRLTELRDMKNKIEMELKMTQPNSIEGRPDENSKEWSTWIMSLFGEDEKREDMPTCDGLRRVFKLVVGDITETYIDVVKAPTSTDQTATVRCSISFIKYGQGTKIRSISDAVDVNQDNTPWPYCKSSVATASTKAEARALRKGLGLVRIYAAEEIQEGMNSDEITAASADGNKPISDSAKIAINTMCNRLSIKPAKLFAFMGIEKSEVANLSYTESHSVLAKLNSFTRGEANGGESVPEQIKSQEMIF